MMSTMIAALMIGVSAAAGGKVEGKLDIGEKNVAVTHGCALLYDDADSLEPAPKIRLLLSDREIALSELEAPALFNLNDLARQGGLQGVQLEFDPKVSPREVSGVVYYGSDDPNVAYPSLSFSGEEAGFSDLKVSADRISGTAAYEREKSEVFADEPGMRYEITFDLPLQKGAAVLETLSGEKAAASEVAKAVLAFEKAVREGDLETAAKLATDNRMEQLKAMMEQVGEAVFKQQVQLFVPETSVRQKQIQKVVIREQRATLLAKEEGATTTMTLVKSGKAWKVD